MPVHLYGQQADMKPIQEMADKHRLSVIGDAAQAHGASLGDKMVGSFGNLECFSFYPTKNMTTGEGGMITTNDDDLFEIANSIRNHGREKTKWAYQLGGFGYNYRITYIAASFVIQKFKKLPGFIEKRRTNARYFDEELEGVETPYVLDNAKHVYHQYTIKCENKERVMENLKKNEIGFGIYYPKPLHQYPHLKQYGHNDLKISESLPEEVISLPVHPALEKQDLKKIIDVVNGACQCPDK